MYAFYLSRIFFLLMPILFGEAAAAQIADSSFVRYTFKDGLTADYISAIGQDDRGYIWIGTDDGLNRYDGNIFSNYRQGSRDMPLLSGRIVNLKQLGRGRTGIVTRAGLQLLSARDLSLENFMLPDSTAFAAHMNDAWDVALLAGGCIALTTNAGYYVFDGHGRPIFRHDGIKAMQPDARTMRYGRDIFPLDSANCLVYVNDYGTAIYNNVSKTFREIDSTDAVWKIFRKPLYGGSRFWINKFQLNADEYIFTLYDKDSIVYYNRRTSRYCSSPLPFHTKTELNWGCRLMALDDSMLLLSSGVTGMYQLSLDRGSGRIICRPDKLMGSESINCMFLDREKRLWIGTENGLLVQKMYPSFIRTYTFRGQQAASFNCVYRYGTKLYAGCFSRSGGLLILDTLRMNVQRQVVLGDGGVGSNEVSSIEMYHPDTLWLGTNAGVYWYDTKTGRQGKVSAEDHGGRVLLSPACADGYAWLCYYLRGVVARYDIGRRHFDFFTEVSHPALPFGSVKSIVYDSYGDVWIGGHALARYNSRKHVFDTMMTVYGGINRFNDDILTMSADSHGSLWLHNSENGLLEYRIADKKFVAYTTSDGLPSASFDCFSPVVDDYLWMACLNSLTRFSIRDKKAVIYDYRDGLPDETPESRSIYYDASANSFYLVCKHELARYTLRQPFHAGGAPVLEKIMINGRRSINFPDTVLRFHHGENNLELFFGQVDLEPGNNAQLFYRMGSQQEWNKLGRQRNAYLSALAPGDYTIQLRSLDKFGNELVKAFHFSVAPPFWKTAVFLTFCALLLCGLLYIVYRRDIRRIRRQADIDKLLAQTEMKALHAQMNPHFIFNSLNSIREMILHDEKKEASEYLGRFARLIRMTLDHSEQAFVSLQSTMEYVAKYVDMERIRNSHFSFEMRLDEAVDAEEVLLPPMLIQPFIENAIWHGMADGRHGIDIRLHFCREGEQLMCVIEDNGIGIHRSMAAKARAGDGHYGHEPVGIYNISSRIRLLNEKYRLDARIVIEDRSEGEGAGPQETGTRIRLFLPIEITFL